MTALLGAAWAALRVAERPRRAWPGAAALLGGAIGAAGLSAAQWWPALAVLARAQRRALPEYVRTFWSVPVEGLLRIVVPLRPSSVPFDERSWTRLFGAPEPPLLASIYLGAPALLLAAAALMISGRRRYAMAIVLLAAMAVTYAMGPHGPLYGLMLAVLPVLRVLRYPSKALVAAAPLTALLAGIGVDAVRRARPSRSAAWALGGLGAALGLGSLVAATRLAPPGAWLWAPALTILAAIVLLSAARARVRSALAAAVLALVCTLDLLAAHQHMTATIPLATLLQPPPAAAAVDRREGRRVYVYDYYSVRGTSERYLGRHDPLRTIAPPPGVDRRQLEAVAQTMYMPAGMAGLFGLENSYDFDLHGLYPPEIDAMADLLRQAEGTPLHTKMLRMGSVGTVLSLHRRGLEDLTLERALPSPFPEPIYVWRVPGAFPRAWVVSCVRVADREPAFRALADPAFDPAREVILPRPAPSGPPSCPAGTARIVARRPDRVRIETEAAAAGYLVTADAYDPGWTAAVDGREGRVLRANIAFRAVAVPAGHHVVDLVYRPRPVLEGIAVSAAFALGGLALAGVGIVRRVAAHGVSPGAPVADAAAPQPAAGVDAS